MYMIMASTATNPATAPSTTNVVFKFLGQSVIGYVLWLVMSTIAGGNTNLWQMLSALWTQVYALNVSLQRWWINVMWPLLCMYMSAEWRASLVSAHAWCVHAVVKALNTVGLDVQDTHVTMILLTASWVVILTWIWILRRAMACMSGKSRGQSILNAANIPSFPPMPQLQSNAIITPQDLFNQVLESNRLLTDNVNVIQPLAMSAANAIQTASNMMQNANQTMTSIMDQSLNTTPAIMQNAMDTLMTTTTSLLANNTAQNTANNHPLEAISRLATSILPPQLRLTMMPIRYIQPNKSTRPTTSDSSIRNLKTSPSTLEDAPPSSKETSATLDVVIDKSMIDAAIPEHPQKSIWLCDAETMTCHKEAVIPMPRETDTPISVLTHDGPNSVLDRDRFHLELINPDRKSAVLKDEAFVSRIAAHHPTFSRTDWSSFQEWHHDRNIVFNASTTTTTTTPTNESPQYEIYPSIVDFESLNDPMLKVNQPLEWRRDMARVASLPIILAPSTTITKTPTSLQQFKSSNQTSSVPSQQQQQLTSNASTMNSAALSNNMNILMEIGKFIGDKCYEIPSTLDLKHEMANIRIPFAGTITYDEFVRQSASFDLFAVRGHGSFSNIIHTVQKHARESSLFTHTGTVLDHTLVWPGGHGAPPNAHEQKFAMEAVMSGDMIEGFDTTTDVYGRSMNGVQIRETYRQMVVKENENSIFFWAKLKPEYRAKVDALLKRQQTSASSLSSSSSSRDPIINVHAEIGKLLGTPYPTNAYNFLYGLFDHFGDDSYFADQEASVGAAVAALDTLGAGNLATAPADPTTTTAQDGHPLRSYVKSKMSESDTHIFCSEMIVRLLARLGILPPLYDKYARQFYPIDLVGDSHLPVLYEAIYIIQHPQLK